ncbi:MAG: alanine--tRNA ligase-related protein, partial [Parvibaculaceae bacterium]
LTERAGEVRDVIGAEADQFARTLSQGRRMLADVIAQAGDAGEGGTISGHDAFRLYDTFGFPLDLTQDILRGRGMSVDTKGFDDAMAQQKKAAREAWAGSGDAASDAIWFRVRDKVGPTEFLGYQGVDGRGVLKSIVVDGQMADRFDGGDCDLVFDRTPFYAESGGQAGDHGEIHFANGARFIVRDVQKRAGDVHVHVGELTDGAISVGDEATLKASYERRQRIRANHSATHLLHAALRDVLGAHVTQKGSLVEEDRLRFDFSHGGPLTPAEIEAIEDQVNAVIRQNDEAKIATMAPDKAIEAGALALFGEKYGDEVRVLSMGQPLTSGERPYSVELCGGTHVSRTGDIAAFVITSEGGVSAGVRRIEAATGAEALSFLKGRAQVALDLADQLKVPLKDVGRKVASISEERRNLERELADAKRKLAMGGGGTAEPAGPEEIGGFKLIARVADGVGGKDLRGLIDEAKSKLGSGIAVFIGVNEGKAAVAVGVTDDLTDKVSAVDLVRVAAAEVGGKGGGGRPDMAQAGGPDGDKAEAALDAVRKTLAG